MLRIRGRPSPTRAAVRLVRAPSSWSFAALHTVCFFPSRLPPLLDASAGDFAAVKVALAAAAPATLTASPAPLVEEEAHRRPLRYPAQFIIAKKIQFPSKIINRGSLVHRVTVVQPTSWVAWFARAISSTEQLKSNQRFRALMHDLEKLNQSIARFVFFHKTSQKPKRTAMRSIIT